MYVLSPDNISLSMHWSTIRLLSIWSQTQCVIPIIYGWYCDQELNKTLQNSSWQRFFIELRWTLDEEILMFSKSSDWWMWCRRWLNLNGKLDNLLTVFFVYFISSSFVANSSKFQMELSQALTCHQCFVRCRVHRRHCNQPDNCSSYNWVLPHSQRTNPVIINESLVIIRASIFWKSKIRFFTM